MNKKYIALGAFVIITLGLLFWLAQNVGALGKGPGSTYTVKLDHAAGLVEDNQVKIAGVKVGVIEDVAVDHDQAVLTLRLDKEVELHVDAIAIVRAKSLLGEKYLQLEPGTLEEKVLDPGSEIENVQNTFEIDEVLNALRPFLGGGDDSITAAMTPLIKRVDRWLEVAEGEEGQPPVITRDQVAESLEDVTASISATRRIIEDNEQGVGELIDNTNRLLTDPRLDRILTNLDRAAATTANRLPGIMDKAETTLANVERVTKELTPERVEKVAKILDDAEVAVANLRDVSDDFKGMGKDLKPIFKNLNKILALAAKIDELTIRKFTQEEGIRVNLGTNKNAKKRIKELDD